MLVYCIVQYCLSGTSVAVLGKNIWGGGPVPPWPQPKTATAVHGINAMFLIQFSSDMYQSWGLRPRSYKTGLRPASVLVLTFWSCFHH